MAWSPWVQDAIDRQNAPEAWSPARRRAEAEWAQIWRGRRGFAVVGKRDSRVVAVERRVSRKLMCHFPNGTQEAA